MEDVKLLIELQEIDSAIIGKADILEVLPKKVSSVEQPLRDAQSSYEKLKQRCEVFVKKKKEKEQALDDVNEKIKKLKSRVSEIKTNKEYQAHLKEIEAAEKERGAVEDEILSLMETLDAANKDLGGQGVKVKAEEGRIEAFRQETQREAREIEKELGELRSHRTALINRIDKELYSLYSKLFDTKRGLAVVETRDEVCQGCNMNIPPQLFVEIKKNERIIQCPQCTRILYAASSRSAEEVPDSSEPPPAPA